MVEELKPQVEVPETPDTDRIKGATLALINRIKSSARETNSVLVPRLGTYLELTRRKLYSNQLSLLVPELRKFLRKIATQSFLPRTGGYIKKAFDLEAVKDEYRALKLLLGPERGAGATPTVEDTARALITAVKKSARRGGSLTPEFWAYLERTRMAFYHLDPEHRTERARELLTTLTGEWGPAFKFEDTELEYRELETMLARTPAATPQTKEKEQTVPGSRYVGCHEIDEKDTELICFECDKCGYHFGLDLTFFDQVGGQTNLTCPSCASRLEVTIDVG